MRLIAFAIVALLIAAAGPTLSQTMSGDENAEPGRFTMSETDDGFLRLDTKLGTVSTCRRRSGDWVCESVADERAAMESEIEKLAEENEKLRGRIAALESGEPQSAMPEAKKDDEGSKLELELPSKEDMDKVMTFFEDAMRRLKDMVDNLEKKENQGSGQDGNNKL